MMEKRCVVNKKKPAVIIFAFAVCVFMRPEAVLADESLGVVNGETLDGDCDAFFVESSSEEIVDDNIPFDVLYPEGRSGNDYDIVDYTSDSLIIGYGNEYVVANFWAYGQAYFYEDGKVHLRSMGIRVNHIEGVTYTVRDLKITITDGSLSTGSAYVDITYKSETITNLIIITLTGGSRDLTTEFFEIL